MAPSSAEPRREFSFRTRQSHWEYLKSLRQPLNVLIVGGGIVGAGVLRALSLRGLSDTVLIEKNDFASATSGASSKLIHAGIRYLESAWISLTQGNLAEALGSFRFVFEASWERRVLGGMAPGLIRPKPIYLVLGEGDPRSAVSVVAGIWLYYLIQLLQAQFFPLPVIALRKSAIRKIAPELDAQKAKGVFCFWDSETDDVRLVMENLQDANDREARAMNYVELVSYRNVKNGVSALVRNRETREELVVNARAMINASGPFLDELRRRELAAEPGLVAASVNPQSALLDRVAGSHVDVYPAVSNGSFYITAGDKRLVFVLRREEDGLVYTRIGTTERPLNHREPSDNVQPTPVEINYLTSLTREYFPAAKLDAAAIIRQDAGIRPLRAQSKEDPHHKSREHALITEGRVVHVAGVKLTDYRRVSRELIATVPWKKWGIGLKGGLSDRTPLRPKDTGAIYRETTMDEIVSHTMPLHWDDYLLRRRGLAPLLAAKQDTARLEKDHALFQSLIKS